MRFFEKFLSIKTVLSWWSRWRKRRMEKEEREWRHRSCIQATATVDAGAGGHAAR